MLLSSSIHSASEWLYYKEYPWVYDAKTEDWLYLQGGTDKKIYAYRASTKKWEEFKIALNFSNTVEEAKVTIYVSNIEKDPNNPATEIKVESADWQQDKGRDQLPLLSLKRFQHLSARL